MVSKFQFLDFFRIFYSISQLEKIVKKKNQKEVFKSPPAQELCRIWLFFLGSSFFSPEKKEEHRPLNSFFILQPRMMEK
jgi:hypothetical protein